jgi:hypothetical protein
VNRRAVALLILMLVPASVVAQQRSAGTIPVSGSELFRFALHEKKLQPHPKVQDALSRPESSIIVVLGNTDGLNLLFARQGAGAAFQEFVQRGGAILIATDRRDRPVIGLSWMQVFNNMEVTGQIVNARPERAYEGNPERPFVRPKAPTGHVRQPSPFELFAKLPESGSSAIATDRPSTMSIPKFIPNCDVESLAGYPDGSSMQRSKQPVHPDVNHFAVSIRPQFSPGRLLILADHSVFANGMMGFPDSFDGTEELKLKNGNWEFTNRTINWLKGGWQEERTHCLFIENGEIKTEFAVPIPPRPKPPIPDLPPDVMANIILNSMNPIIDEAQEKNLFNRILEGWFGFPRLVRLFIYVVTALLVFAGLRWLARGQRKVEPGTTLSAAGQAALLPRGGVLRQRTTAQIEVANLYEAASGRVRDRFDVLGGRPAPNGGMPPVLVAGDLNDGPVLRRTVEWLWSVGYGDRPVPVTPAEWDQMNRLLERVMLRASQGHWSFGQEA